MPIRILLFVLFAVALPTGCIFPRRESEVKLEEKKGTAYIKNEQKPYTGIIFKKNSNGQLCRETIYKNGKKHGIEKWYDRDGQLTRIFHESC
ncbi:hypothetical protein ACFL35_16720 [Candidatus Riflebacteria bacterium]